jgi:hypothetical protein
VPAPDRITVVDIARRDFHSQQFPLVIDDQVQLEPIKPIHARLSPGSKLCHHFMRPNAAIVAHTDLGRINKADPTVIGPLISQHLAQIIELERPVTRQMKPHHDCHDFA